MPALADISDICFVIFSGFLYKLISTFRAGDLNLALSSGNANLLGAGGAFKKAKNLCLFPLFALSVEVFKQRAHEFQKTFVFPSSFLMIMRKKAEQAEQKRKQSDRIQALHALHRDHRCQKINQNAQ